MTPGKEERRNPGLMNAERNGATSLSIEIPALHAPHVQKQDEKKIKKIRQFDDSTIRKFGDLKMSYNFLSLP